MQTVLFYYSMYFTAIACAFAALLLVKSKAVKTAPAEGDPVMLNRATELSEAKVLPGGLIVTYDHKQVLFELLKEDIEKAATKEDLSVVCVRLETFKKAYGKCQMYCELYSDYVGALVLSEAERP